ncbi:MAG: ABC transporter ATP-binding protein, partial [Candidatus Eremiobacteraeota bacterium]|nr:ABC transporter ATP-binding protein [Candidatus Eremiobacteraeota bacterium]
EYRLNGNAVQAATPDERSRVRNREIGFIFQNFNLIGDLTVAENVELPLVYRGLSARERKRRVGEALDRVAMSHRTGHFPAQLSGGQQQRVAVARALAGEPSVLLADEPTGNLDSKNGESVMELLQELHDAGSTIVIVTHDRKFAHCAKRTIGLLDGKIVPELEAAAAS